MIKISKTCERCHKIYDEYPALSRIDNTTEICSSCGTDEAMFEFMIFNMEPEKALKNLKSIIKTEINDFKREHYSKIHDIIEKKWQDNK